MGRRRRRGPAPAVDGCDLAALLAGGRRGRIRGTGQAIGGGLAVTGNYPGRARTPDELRSDLDQRPVPLARHITD